MVIHVIIFYGDIAARTYCFNIVRTAGFSYDNKQDIIYSNLNPIQRYFGFSNTIDRLTNVPINNERKDMAQIIDDINKIK